MIGAVIRDSDGLVYNGEWCWVDGAMSGARHSSKQVRTRLQVEHEGDQHERRERETAHMPRPSTPPLSTPSTRLTSRAYRVVKD